MTKSSSEPLEVSAEPHAKVIVNYLACIDAKGVDTGKKIAQITLNKSKSLNALDLDMVNLMLEALQQIRHDIEVSAVLLDGAGDRAFCAGGDVVSMHRSMKSHTVEHVATANPNHVNIDTAASTPAFLKEFFTQEYRLDYCLHTFPKPVVVWGNGIIMGGGLGLFAAAQIKLVTETARIAMPEITIGLFPDVGGSYFLNRLPAGLGLFLGLTAASINAQDTLAIGFADAVVSHASKEAFVRSLCQLPTVNRDTVVNLAASCKPQSQDLQAPKLTNLLDSLGVLNNANSASEVAASLSQIVADNPQNSYLTKAFSTFEGGSPITAHLVYQQLKRAKYFSLAECFRMELSMAWACGAFGEFEEGVRALLIDKDNNPTWRYSSINDVPDSVIQAHFSQFADAGSVPHPLGNLEQEFGV